MTEDSVERRRLMYERKARLKTIKDAALAVTILSSVLDLYLGQADWWFLSAVFLAVALVSAGVYGGMIVLLRIGGYGFVTLDREEDSDE